MSKTVTEEVKTEVKEQVNSTVEDVQKAADDNLDTIDTNARYMGETGPGCSFISTFQILITSPIFSLWCTHKNGSESFHALYCLYI